MGKTIRIYCSYASDSRSSEQCVKQLYEKLSSQERLGQTFILEKRGNTRWKPTQA
jgi:hypothetical protein